MSKKFTLITFQIQDGDHEYFDHISFLTSDYLKMNEMQMVSYFFKMLRKRTQPRLAAAVSHAYSGGRRSQSVELSDSHVCIGLDD